jgi:hypothetical protein
LNDFSKPSRSSTHTLSRSLAEVCSMAFYIVISSTHLCSWRNFMEMLSGLRGKRREFRYCSIFFWFLISLSEKFQRYIKVPNLIKQLPCHPFDFLKPRININLQSATLDSTISKRHEGSWKLPTTVPHPNRISQEITPQINSRVLTSFRPPSPHHP